MELIAAVAGAVAGVAALALAYWIYRRQRAGARADREQDRRRSDAVRRAERLLPRYEATAERLKAVTVAAERLADGALGATGLEELQLPALADTTSELLIPMIDELSEAIGRRPEPDVWELQDAHLTVIRLRQVPAVPGPEDLDTALRQATEDGRTGPLHALLVDVARHSARQSAAAADIRRAVTVLSDHVDHNLRDFRRVLEGSPHR